MPLINNTYFASPVIWIRWKIYCVLCILGVSIAAIGLYLPSPYVFYGGNKLHVIHINARPISTKMVYGHVAWDASMFNEPRNPMHWSYQFSPPHEFHISISTVQFRSSELYTSIFEDLGVPIKPVFGCFLSGAEACKVSSNFSMGTTIPFRTNIALEWFHGQYSAIRVETMSRIIYV